MDKSIVNTIVAALVRQNRQRRAVNDLLALDDRLLEDMGFSRGSIRQTVRRGGRG
ncbi:MAG: DUF1127 domain-containing protein [Devosia sp.]|jgi:uncharacterized protein YjiS (DUF1127 family)|nr:DUF1127 domain-containing protein [Devosiaceae bacterium]